MIEQDRDKEAERRTGRNIDRGLLATYAISLVGAAALTLMSL